jgi:error-prone DNA polymerase
MAEHVPYAELHCHSSFSFGDGASDPEELVAEAARKELDALALTDHGGLYGAVRFARAAAELAHDSGVRVRTVFGAELTLGDVTGRGGEADPRETHLVVLARDPEGYRRLCGVLSEAKLAGGAKGCSRLELAQLAEAHGGHWAVLTGCRKGLVPAALVHQGPEAARRALRQLVDAFGREHVVVELADQGDPLDRVRNDALALLGAERGLAIVATTNVHYHHVRAARRAAVLAAVRARRPLAEMDGWLPAGPGAALRSGAEAARRFARWPGTVEAAAALGQACAFDLALVAPGLPRVEPGAGLDDLSLLRRLVEEGGTVRYGPRGAERVRGAWAQLDHELDVIGQLGFAGYFLVVWEIVRFCRQQGIYCQGRGSAANSAVCYALGITNADAVGLGLLFERFLSPARDGPPDIDVDIESGRREEVIQHVYERYGRRHAAQVANVITYRTRSALRDAARALGYAEGTIDAWSREVEHRRGGRPGVEGPSPYPEHVPTEVVELAEQLRGLPRHLGVHSGGMVICDRPVGEVCPVEWATAPGRTVLQWDKDDCAAIGLVKFDLLGLGMLSALHRSVDLVVEYHGIALDLALLPQEPEVYEMLAAGDSVGVFQVESRAQMATLPRLRPSCFYDLVVEVALIRPGPIQGGSVHPYLRRRAGTEPVTYLHPLLERALAKTLGVPLFQEQLMQIAIDAAGFSPAEADQLRQAMGAKRSRERMERLADRLYRGMAERGIVGETADAIYAQMAAFASFGFPESHAVSFAYLVYSSAWLKRHYPAAFFAGLLDSQPMGFWSPQTLLADARRHGVRVLGPDVNVSRVRTSLEPEPGAPVRLGGVEPPALRLGLAQVVGLGEAVAERIVEAREAGGVFVGTDDLARRADLDGRALEALALAGALAWAERRPALWEAGVAGRFARAEQLPLGLLGTTVPDFEPLSPLEETAADLGSTGVALGFQPLELERPALAARGILTAAELAGLDDGRRVSVAGVVTHRQRPGTAKGTTFVNLEDETGLVNVICSPGVWARYRPVARRASALVVRGRLERTGGALNVVAERIWALDLGLELHSRDFQ